MTSVGVITTLVNNQHPSVANQTQYARPKRLALPSIQHIAPFPHHPPPLVHRYSKTNIYMQNIGMHKSLSMNTYLLVLSQISIHVILTIENLFSQHRL
jgi:hypothetical protein